MGVLTHPLTNGGPHSRLWGSSLHTHKLCKYTIWEPSWSGQNFWKTHDFLLLYNYLSPNLCSFHIFFLLTLLSAEIITKMLHKINYLQNFSADLLQDFFSPTTSFYRLIFFLGTWTPGSNIVFFFCPSHPPIHFSNKFLRSEIFST